LEFAGIKGGVRVGLTPPFAIFPHSVHLDFKTDSPHDLAAFFSHHHHLVLSSLCRMENQAEITQNS